MPTTIKNKESRINPGKFVRKNWEELRPPGLKPRKSFSELLADELLASILPEIPSLVNKETGKNELVETFKHYPELKTFVGDYLERIKEHSEETALHVEEVSVIAARSAEHLVKQGDYGPAKAADFIIAAILHDTGKLETAKEIVNKPDRLTDDEMQEMQRHLLFSSINLDIYLPKKDYTSAGEIDSRADIAQIIHNHHERLDGWGYPGLKDASQIRNPEDRTFPIVDAYEAQTGERKYKATSHTARTSEQAIANLLEESDPSPEAVLKRGTRLANGRIKALRTIAQKDDDQGKVIREILEKRGVLHETDMTPEKIIELGRLPGLDREQTLKLIPVFRQYEKDKQAGKDNGTRQNLWERAEAKMAKAPVSETNGIAR